MVRKLSFHSNMLPLIVGPKKDVLVQSLTKTGLREKAGCVGGSDGSRGAWTDGGSEQVTALRVGELVVVMAWW
jgi:hypothetical protein